MRCATHTGYTHRWHRTEAQPYADILMASVDTEAEAEAAQRLGWRYFRVRRSVSDVLTASERMCPASAEFGQALTCAECGLCDGLSTPNAANITIFEHGWRAAKSITRSAKRQGAQRIDKRAQRVPNSLLSLV